MRRARAVWLRERGGVGRLGALVVAAVSAACAAGCGPDTLPPEATIRVAVSTDAADKFERLWITVTRGGGEPKVNNTYGRETIDNLPDSLLLKNAMAVDDTGNPIYMPIVVRVAGLPGEDAMKPDIPVVERSAQLEFVTDRPVLLRMPLCDSCVGVPCDNPDTTCLQGKCKPQKVDIGSLPEDDGSQPLESIECSGASP